MKQRHPHSICILEQDNDNRALYGKVHAYLSEGYSVVYAVEASAKDAIAQMNNAGIRAENYIDNNALTIIDRSSIYSQSKTNNFDGHLLLDKWKQIISEVNQKEGTNSKFKSIALFGMPEPFFETMNHQKLIEYEQLASKDFLREDGCNNNNMEAICCYTREEIAELSLAHVISLLNAHHHTLASTEEYYEWIPGNLLQMIGKGFERILGKRTSEVVFELLGNMYKIDETVLASQPIILENAIRKFFSASADLALDAVKREIVASVLFDQKKRTKNIQNEK